MTTLIITIIVSLIALIAILFSKRLSSQCGSEDISKYFRWGGFIILGLMLLVLGINALTTVQSGTAKVQKLFGKYQQGYIAEGTHVVNPLADLEATNIQRNAITVQDGDNDPGMSCTTNDEIQVNVQSNFSFAFNSEYIWWLRTYIGDDKKIIAQIIEKAAQSATRDVLASYTLVEARISKRAELEEDLRKAFFEGIVSNLPKDKGLSDSELKNVIDVFPTQLMNIQPDDKVINALNEKKATEIDLGKQMTLTNIAKEVANRREQEGKGIKKMFDELPKGYTAQDVAFVLEASANKTRAEAMLKAVEGGKVSSIIFEGSSARTKQ